MCGAQVSILAARKPKNWAKNTSCVFSEDEESVESSSAAGVTRASEPSIEWLKASRRTSAAIQLVVEVLTGIETCSKTRLVR